MEKWINSYKTAKSRCNNPNGKFIKTWKSMSEIQKELGFSQGNISSACCGRYKQAYGYIWTIKKTSKIN